MSSLSAINRPAIALAALATMMSTARADEMYTLDPSHTVPAFAVSHLGISTQIGFFTRTSGTVSLDRAARTGTIDVSIAAASLDTGESLRDRFVRGDDWLAVDRFPTIQFRASRWTFDGDRPVGASGELTLRGQARPVELKIDNFKCVRHAIFGRPVCGATVTTAIKRADFGMTAWAHDVGDEVRITIQVEALQDEASVR